MIKLKALLNNKWFFPVLMLYYGIFYISFGEIYYMNGGMSVDGVVFSSFISSFKASYFFDTYYVHRIFPSLLIGTFFKLFSISQTGSHIYTAFQILNLSGIVLSCYFLKKILLLFKISLKNQLLAFTLFLVNFAMLKLPFYLAIMTDTTAMALSTMMLFFYLKNNSIGVIICTLLACFTWPFSFYQGLIFVAIPFYVLPFSELKIKSKIILRVSSTLLALLICLYIIVIEKMDTSLELVSKIDRTLLPLSIAGVSMFYFFFSSIFFNSYLFNIRLFFSKLKPLPVFIAIALLGLTLLIVYFLKPAPNRYYPILYILANPFKCALIWPLVTLVAHSTFWGVLTILLLFFWKDFCKLISRMGWGIVAALGLNLFLFGIMSETRCLINIFPWLVIFFVKAVNKYSFSNSFYIVVAILCFAGSKIWLILNPGNGKDAEMQLDKNGNMGFPNQKLWMHIGPWMSEKMYYVQGGFVLLFVVILFFMLYKIEIKKFTTIRLVKKY